MSANQTPPHNTRYVYRDITPSILPSFSEAKYKFCSLYSKDITSSICISEILVIDTTINKLIGDGIYLFEYENNLLVREFDIVKGKYKTVGYKELDEDYDYNIESVKILGVIVGTFKYLNPTIDELFNTNIGE